MDFIKRQLFFLICGVAALGGIALGVTGMSKLSEVKTQMEDAVRLYGELTSLPSGAANSRFIELEQARIARQRAAFDALVDQVDALQPYEPLLEDFFPSPAADKVERDMLLEFRTRYQAAVRDLYVRLNAGQRATTVEVQKAAEEIRIEEQQAKAFSQGGAPAEAEPAYTNAGVLTQAGARLNADARANLEKAQMLFCYAEPLLAEIPAFEFSSKLEGSSRYEVEFTVSDCWDAQVKLWITQDVVDALARVNAQAADALVAKGQAPWVGVLPVKDIISIRVCRDVIQGALAEGATPDLGMPQGVGAADPVCATDVSFANRYSEDGSMFDVVQFTLKLVVDQRDLLQVIREISKDRFHTLLRCSYVAVPPDPSMRGKIYGAEPVVKVVLDFETHMLADKYRRLMPDDILEAYGFTRPADEDEREGESEDGGA